MRLFSTRANFHVGNLDMMTAATAPIPESTGLAPLIAGLGATLFACHRALR